MKLNILKCVCIVFQLVSLCANAQIQRSYNWAAGANTLLSSTGGAFILSNSSMSPFEGSATISDTSGRLLFYTNGVTVWDSTHTVMPNGTGLASDPSSTCAAIIVPQPGNDSIFYIFTVDAQAGYFSGDGACRYSTVNMNVNNGFGDVVQKNIFLYDLTTEKLCAVKHGNGRDYWIMTHQFNTNLFYAYLVTDTGVSTVPVISASGQIHPSIGAGDWGQHAPGGMKFSPSGCRLALVLSQLHTVELFSFDKNSGAVFNPQTFTDSLNILYDVCFSPDNSKLYYSSLNAVLQLDLSLANYTAIAQSRTQVSTIWNGCGLQIGPDTTIYIANYQDSYLSRINQPNLAGAACGYQAVACSLYGGSGYGLPNFVQNFLPSSGPPIICEEYDGMPEPSGELFFSMFPNPATASVIIDYPGLEVTCICIRDVAGRIVLCEVHPARERTSLDVSTLPSGIYLVSVKTTRRDYVSKLLVE